MDPVTRSLVLWIPDWPVVALARDPAAHVEADEPVAVLEANVVAACSPAARADGVRRGLRRRDAQARCPRLRVVASDPARDLRVFEPVVARIEELAPGVQPIRPGLCALRVRGPARYYGGEAAAARTLLASLAELGFPDVRAGIADGPFTAEQAARSASPSGVRTIPPGEAAAFLAPLSLTALDAPELAELLARLGVQTLGAFADLDPSRVLDRFGPAGARLQHLAAGRDSRPVQPRTPPPELSREVTFEPPLELVDQVAFGVRIAAEEFIAGLGEAGLVCTELRIELDVERGQGIDRVWLHPGSFDRAGVVDRVRWQVQALGESGGISEITGGVSRVRIIPEAVDAASHHQPAIFGAGTDERVHHTLSRVQAMLGHRGVLTSAIGGGRWLAERQVLVPWGDRVVLTKERARPWPGSLAGAQPATVFPAPQRIGVTDAEGRPVEVDERDRLSAPPAVLTERGRSRAVAAWAGPWPVIERGWDAARTRIAHRLQVVDTDQTAWLVVHERGEWTAEGRYD